MKKSLLIFLISFVLSSGIYSFIKRELWFIWDQKNKVVVLMDPRMSEDEFRELIFRDADHKDTERNEEYVKIVELGLKNGGVTFSYESTNGGMVMRFGRGYTDEEQEYVVRHYLSRLRGKNSGREFFIIKPSDQLYIK
ncbi:MAG: hypothetical protein NZM04_10410 [Methylacidiphilales bacterium]|nr:hypothetical protein [Candidatus Methylacidiphilales bacterium]